MIQHLSVQDTDLTDLCTFKIEEELEAVKNEAIQLIKNIQAYKKFAFRGDFTQFMKMVIVVFTGDTYGNKKGRYFL